MTPAARKMSPVPRSDASLFIPLPYQTDRPQERRPLSRPDRQDRPAGSLLSRTAT